MSPAALGFRAHSGWAALVVVAGDPRSPEAVLRERIVMADDPEARQPYHAAEGLEPKEAARVLGRLTSQAHAMARRALTRVLRDLRGRGYEPGTAGVVQAAGRLPKDLGAILSSHALIHTADGEHFRDALAHASARAGLGVLRVPERALHERAAAALRRPPEDLQREVASWGRSLGAPWTADQKLAALLAWLLLAEAPGHAE